MNPLPLRRSRMDIQTLATYTMPVQCQAMDQIEQGHLVMHQQHKKACYAT